MCISGYGADAISVASMSAHENMFHVCVASAFRSWPQAPEDVDMVAVLEGLI